MRTTIPPRLACLLMFAAGCAAARADDSSSPATSALEPRFRAEVRPFLAEYCLGCHGKDHPKGDLDLSGFTSAGSVAEDLPRWAMVQEQLEAGTMPPAKAKKQPSGDARRSLLDWVARVRKAEAARTAGDPGHVPARRLSNAEYDHTIRDLTGVDLRPTGEFPVDPANAAGFDNSGESLAMSPALARKYLEAARRVADHAVLTPDGIAFAPHPMLADTDRDKYGVKAILDFYRRQKTDLADYFLAAWRFRHRDELGRPAASLDDLADANGLSRKYLATIWRTLEEGREDAGPVAALRALWRSLPTPDAAHPDAARAGCERIRDLVTTLRGRLVPEVKNMTARGIDQGTQPFVLWKNRQMAANRMRYVGNASRVKLDGLHLDGNRKAALAMAVPSGPEHAARYEAGFARFCRVFPDAFCVTERGRVYLKKEDSGNTGRLLSAGFHSMTGYFRDDGPLYELILDDAGRHELDRLWRQFDFITGAPLRQYASYLWYERAETGFLKGDKAFDFVRAEDPDSSSEDKMGRFEQAYLAKARRLGAGERPLGAIRDQFRIIAASIRSVQAGRRDAEPRHVKALQAFAERAFRRPLSAQERRDIEGFYRTLREQDGLGHEDAVRDTLASILLSPHFCYRMDLAGAEPGVHPLSDLDLASRMSYFLWASLPDAELLSLASAGELRKPAVLTAQARRMLRDERVRGLATEFAGNWLDFRRFEEHNSVDRGRFPAFDDELRRSMFEEPIRFFLDVVRNDRPVTEFLDGSHTFVNPALAIHYGMPAPKGASGDWVRVDDAVCYGRGGLLPMAVFLTRNSPGLRTSPVKRGYWVVRRLLGENIPPPPPNVPDLPDDEAKLGDITLREALARHRADKACAGCHERFDGIGLAFEGYGPVGEARARDLGGRPVDARASFPRGGEGTGLEGLRAYLQKTRRDEFAENLCRKLLAYGLGRTLIPSDDETIVAMRKALDSDGRRFGVLVETIVASPQFRNKRIEAPRSE
ncbi:DUF1592 domain-containing protein [Aquisphaera insulae]|uniref:DUF1592 domain-containing protein n=1 Tax=Aquisphaera insulae TaxID=2712864 RepID=UPI0013EAA4C7|nr:DUF1592 domain-containing protein [Aquisphaera insulae]